MIGKLVGVVSGYYGNIVLLDVYSNNTCIGYEILMKQNDILSLKIGEISTIFIKEIITEDNDIFYGFLSFEDKCWFEEMIKISGLGPKTALNILSNYSCETITEAIMMNNCDFFSSISGIGSKIANRIPTEMKKQISKINEKVLSFKNYDINNIQTKPNVINNIDTKQTDKLYQDIDTPSIDNKQKKYKQKSKNNNLKQEQNISEIVNEAVNALIALGFSKQKIYNEVYNIVKNNKENSITTENVIKDFLKKLDK